MPDAGTVDPPPTDQLPAEYGSDEYDPEDYVPDTSLLAVAWEADSPRPVLEDLEVVANTDFNLDGINDFDVDLSLTDDQLAGIMAGTITSWAQLGLQDVPVVVVRDPLAGHVDEAIYDLLRDRGLAAAADAFPAGIPSGRHIEVDSPEAAMDVLLNTPGTIALVPADLFRGYGFQPGLPNTFQVGVPGKRPFKAPAALPWAEFGLIGMGNGTSVNAQIFAAPTIRLWLKVDGQPGEEFSYRVTPGSTVKGVVDGLRKDLDRAGWDVSVDPDLGVLQVYGRGSKQDGTYKAITEAGIIADKFRNGVQPVARGMPGVTRMLWGRYEDANRFSRVGWHAARAQ